MLQEDQYCRIVFEGKEYDSRHGGPFDRGSADSWYGRGKDPHFYQEGTGTSQRVERLNAQELEAYYAGYAYNEMHGGKKSWD